MSGDDGVEVGLDAGLLGQHQATRAPASTTDSTASGSGQADSSSSSTSRTTTCSASGLEGRPAALELRVGRQHAQRGVPGLVARSARARTPGRHRARRRSGSQTVSTPTGTWRLFHCRVRRSSPGAAPSSSDMPTTSRLPASAQRPRVRVELARRRPACARRSSRPRAIDRGGDPLGGVAVVGDRHVAGGEQLGDQDVEAVTEGVDLVVLDQLGREPGRARVVGGPAEHVDELARSGPRPWRRGSRLPALAAGHPQHVALLAVGVPGEDEQQVGEPVEVGDRERRSWSRRARRAPPRPTARPGVRRCARRAAARRRGCRR